MGARMCADAQFLRTLMRIMVRGVQGEVVHMCMCSLQIDGAYFEIIDMRGECWCTYDDPRAQSMKLDVFEGMFRVMVGQINYTKSGKQAAI